MIALDLIHTLQGVTHVELHRDHDALAASNHSTVRSLQRELIVMTVLAGKRVYAFSYTRRMYCTAVRARHVARLAAACCKRLCVSVAHQPPPKAVCPSREARTAHRAMVPAVSTSLT